MPVKRRQELRGQQMLMDVDPIRATTCRPLSDGAALGALSPLGQGGADRKTKPDD